MIAARTLALVATLFGIPALASAQQVTLHDPAIAVEPGHHAEIPFVFTNAGTAASPEVHFQLPAADESPYTFTQQTQDGCGAIGPSNITSVWPAFTVAPIPPGGSRTCVVGVDRPADAIDNQPFGWYVSEGDSWIWFEVGTFTDIAIAATRVESTHEADGSTSATYRFDARNIGSVGADDARFSIGPSCGTSPIGVDMDFPGGCTRDQSECGFTGGPGPAARFSIAAGQGSSCLVRFTAPAGLADPHITVSRFGPMVDEATGGYIGDRNSANDSLVLDIVGGVPVAASAPALSPWSMAVLGLLLAALAFGARRRSAR